MRRKSLTIAAAVAVAIAAVTVPAAAEQQTKAPAAGADCASTPQRMVCFTRKTPAGAKPTKASGAVGTAAVPCREDTWNFDRFFACTWERGWLEIYNEVCSGGACKWVPTGWMELVLRFYSTTHYNGHEWDLKAEVEGLSAGGSGHRGVLVNADFGCAGSCESTGDGFAAQHLNVGVTTSGKGWFSTNIDAPGQTRYGHASVTFTFSPPSGIGSPGTYSKEVLPQVRCDSVLNPTGCVYPAIAPVFGLNSWEYPEAAEHVDRAQRSGLIGKDIPLHRTLDVNQQNDNRNTSCPDGLPRPELESCDEYPFASTMEGAAATGPEAGRTFRDCNMDHLPEVPVGQNVGTLGWSACMIDHTDNVGAGGALGNFYQEQRVLHNEQFYVEVNW